MTLLDKALAQPPQPRILPPITADDLNWLGGQQWSDPLEIARFVVGRLILPILAGLLILYIVWAGYQLITSSGDPERAKRAQASLTYVVIGLILTLLSFGLVAAIYALIRQAAGVR
jgi:hypothetical protein